MIWTLDVRYNFTSGNTLQATHCMTVKAQLIKLPQNKNKKYATNKLKK